MTFLAANEASAGRGALLTVAYCLGLGVPFVLAAMAFRKAMGAFAWVKQRYVWVMRLGGGMMIVTGLLLLTGAWGRLIEEVQSWSQGFTVGICHARLVTQAETDRRSLNSEILHLLEGALTAVETDDQSP